MVYDVKSNGVTIEFTRNFKDAEAVYQSSMASTKEIFLLVESGRRNLILSNRREKK